MSVNESIDPRFLYHVEDESLRFRVGESAPKIRELETVGDRRFRIRQGFCGNRVEKDETRYSDGDGDEYNVSFRSHGALIHHPSNNGDSDSAAAETNKESKNPGSVGWELVVREDEERKASMIDRHEMEFKVMITNPDDNVSHSHHNTLSKRDFASLEKERVTSVSSSWESLKAILSDPVTGTLMNDATILPCGHSFGAGGLKEVKRMKACFTCSQPTSEGSGKPNLSLRIVVHAFCQEEESDYIHSLKRRKDKSDQQKRSFCIPKITETPKSSRGIQFPFSIGDLIIIEGNKRTPPRFVGRRAVIMTQCLNGWYVVKTVDNAESIKLQHCSLAKISDNSPAKVTVAEMAPSWL
ncbi:PREDICTED: U-box domain-containing protein 63-like isoform X1 [Camelina sativa]|uniref:U-box domain-containing protein 63-like isoform X1 n=1 Tax=Camelina sativa TaxID=90675 RepID=A0ABM0Z0S6_CAMSA|nr:PREDICTED: U-box domain-containing protein 63-like isoform X1 [Camelina sativa]